MCHRWSMTWKRGKEWSCCDAQSSVHWRWSLPSQFWTLHQHPGCLASLLPRLKIPAGPGWLARPPARLLLLGEREGGSKNSNGPMQEQMNGAACIKEILNWNFKSSWCNEDIMHAQYLCTKYVAWALFVQVITSCRTVTPGTSNSVCGVSFHPKDRDVVCIGQFPLLALTGALYAMMHYYRSDSW